MSLKSLSLGENKICPLKNISCALMSLKSLNFEKKSKISLKSLNFLIDVCNNFCSTNCLLSDMNFFICKKFCLRQPIYLLDQNFKLYFFTALCLPFAKLLWINCNYLKIYVVWFSNDPIFGVFQCMGWS